MPAVRALRRSHGLTLVDLALLTGIPARTLGEIEYGLRRLDADTRARLASLFDIRADLLQPSSLVQDAPGTTSQSAQPLGVVAAAMVGVASALLLAPLADPAPLVSSSIRLAQRKEASQSIPAAVPSPLPVTATPLPATPAPRLAAVSQRQLAPRAEVAATNTPTPAWRLEADGPHGCPLDVDGQRVVMTQGYGEGTHAPASIWGGVDLAIDGDNDGNPEPASTRGVPIVATHSGTARVYLGSWPAGNYVRIEHATTGWSSAYAHLESVFVSDGQSLTQGDSIGTVGSTGFTSGPHLHYEVWQGKQNVDPTGLIECGQPSDDSE